MPSFEVDAAIFEKLPALKVIDLRLIDREGTCQLLSQEWHGTWERLASLPNVQSHPNILAWRTAYSSLGIPLRKYTSSIENLTKHTTKPDSHPRSICPLADFYNALNLRTLLPFGDFDLADPSISGMALRFTTTGDVFHSLDASEAEAVPEGEAAYCGGNIVLTRHINWKQSREGLISENTKDVVFMAEILGTILEQQVQEIKALFEEECIHLLKVSPMTYILDQAHPKVDY